LWRFGGSNLDPFESPETYLARVGLLAGVGLDADRARVCAGHAYHVDRRYRFGYSATSPIVQNTDDKDLSYPVCLFLDSHRCVHSRCLQTRQGIVDDHRDVAILAGWVVRNLVTARPATTRVVISLDLLLDLDLVYRRAGAGPGRGRGSGISSAHAPRRDRKS